MLLRSLFHGDPWLICSRSRISTSCQQPVQRFDVDRVRKDTNFTGKTVLDVFTVTPPTNPPLHFCLSARTGRTKSLQRLLLHRPNHLSTTGGRGLGDSNARTTYPVDIPSRKLQNHCGRNSSKVHAPNQALACVSPSTNKYTNRSNISLGPHDEMLHGRIARGWTQERRPRQNQSTIAVLWWWAHRTQQIRGCRRP